MFSKFGNVCAKACVFGEVVHGTCVLCSDVRGEITPVTPFISGRL